MAKPVEYRQGETVFYIHRFPAFQAMTVLGDLQKVLLPALGGAMGTAKGIDLDSQDMAALGAVLTGICDKLPEYMDAEKMGHYMRLLLIDSENIGVKTRDGVIKLNEYVINDIFDGHPLDILALMAKVIKVNFMDFSRLCSLPTGVREAFAGIDQKFRANVAANLNS